MHDHAEPAFAGQVEAARALRDSLEPVRRALRQTPPGGKSQAHQKNLQELLGQAGGPVRPPPLQLTAKAKAATAAAFEGCGLKVWPRFGPRRGSSI